MNNTVTWVGVILFAVLCCFIAGTTHNNLNQSSQSLPPIAKSATSPTINPAPSKVIKPAPLRHDILINEITNNSVYWNLPWQGKTGDLINVARETNLQYLQTHTYIANETDCNDMAIDMWNMLWTQGIRSIIVLGNINQDTYAFDQCNHTWLLIFHLERDAASPWNLPLEPTNGEIYFRDDVVRNPQLDRYSTGFYYIQPSDLREDLGENW